MRVGIFSYEYLPLNGGISRYLCELSRRLLNFPGITFTIFSPSQTDSTFHQTILRKTKSRFSPFKHLGFSFKLNNLFNFLIKTYRLECAHIMAGPGGILLFRKLSIPTIMTVHGTYYQQLVVNRFSLSARILYYLERRSFHFSDRIICPSESVKNILISFYAVSRDYIVCIPHGIDKNIFFPNSNILQIPRSVLYVGRLHQSKGIRMLLKVVLNILPHYPDVRFYIVGDGPFQKHIVYFIKKYNLENTVVLLGWLQEDKLRYWYNRCLVYVNPSMRESFSFTTAEALSCGAPVVATNIDGIRDLIKEGYNGFLVPLHNTEEFASKILYFFEHPELRNQFSRNREHGLLSWDVVILRTVLEYKNIIHFFHSQ